MNHTLWWSVIAVMTQPKANRLGKLGSTRRPRYVEIQVPREGTRKPFVPTLSGTSKSEVLALPQCYI